ncbi:hypothetical protein [Streptomyces sp. RFCAC02]|uniref:hypothetical protein n=1 Tax=Streptomyces sp. RFCAC02 TaxID=2499143 RepID=UPI00101E9D22|nr:hypothetical protein [Streptomyces sp. RFCAC02]
MHRSARLPLPVAAAASTLLLITGCANEDAPFGIEAGDIYEAPDDSDVEDLPEFDEDDLGGDTGGDLGGETDGSSAEGDWYLDPADLMSTNLYIMGNSVLFFAENNDCQGTFADNTVTLTSCTEGINGEQWTEMTATVTPNGDGTLDVTWDSGRQETYFIEQ